MQKGAPTGEPKVSVERIRRMQLTAFRILKYRNIEDSGLIKLADHLTCIVGKNQSGKTNLLRGLHKFSRVLLFIHDAKRKSRIFCVSWRSAMNFVRESVFAGPMRNSGSAWRSAFATTSSDGGMPGRMVRNQDPNESQTSLGATTARYWRSPWATTPAWMKA